MSKLTDYIRNNSLNEAPMLGPKGKIHRATDSEQSDREYIEQRKFKDNWKKENPGKKWPGYGKAGFKIGNDGTHLQENDIVNFSMFAGMYSDGARASFIGRDGKLHKLQATGDRPRKYFIDGVETEWNEVKRLVGKQKIKPIQGMNEANNIIPKEI